MMRRVKRLANPRLMWSSAPEGGMRVSLDDWGGKSYWPTAISRDLWQLKTCEFPCPLVRVSPWSLDTQSALFVRATNLYAVAMGLFAWGWEILTYQFWAAAHRLNMIAEHDPACYVTIRDLTWPGRGRK